MFESRTSSDYLSFAGNLLLCLLTFAVVFIIWKLVFFFYDRVRDLLQEDFDQQPACNFVKEINSLKRTLRYFALKVKCEQWPYLNDLNFKYQVDREWNLINSSQKRVYTFEDDDDVVGGIYQCYLGIRLRKGRFWYVDDYGLDLHGCSSKKFRALIDTVEEGFLKEPIYIEIEKDDKREIGFFEQCGFRLMRNPPASSKNPWLVVYHRPTVWMHEEYV